MSSNTTGFAEGAQSPFWPLPPPPLIQKVEIGKGGRVVIPAAMRVALGVKEGDLLLLKMDGDELKVVSFMANLRKMQAEMMAKSKPGVSYTDEVIADRRREAVREWDEAVLGPLPEALQAYR